MAGLFRKAIGAQQIAGIRVAVREAVTRNQRPASPRSGKSRMMVLRSPSSLSSSLKMGSETTYFSLAQFPKSRSRQRSLQKGKSACTFESVAVLHIGHLCFIWSGLVCNFFLGSNANRFAARGIYLDAAAFQTDSLNDLERSAGE